MLKAVLTHPAPRLTLTLEGEHDQQGKPSRREPSGSSVCGFSG